MIKLLCLSSFLFSRADGFGGCGETGSLIITPCPFLSSGWDCPKTSTPPTNGTMENLSFLKVWICSQSRMITLQDDLASKNAGMLQTLCLLQNIRWSVPSLASQTASVLKRSKFRREESGVGGSGVVVGRRTRSGSVLHQPAH